MTSKLNHVALLVNNIEAFLESNPSLPKATHKIEEFPSEGTRELYLGENSQLGRLLLMQAIGEGPYKEALKKRGPGLHHIAIDVPKVDDFTGELAGSGWLLHPKSLWFYDDIKQVYLCRPGVPVIIEVKERPQALPGNLFIDTIELPLPNDRLLTALNCPQLKMGPQLRMSINNEVFSPNFT